MFKLENSYFAVVVVVDVIVSEWFVINSSKISHADDAGTTCIFTVLFC